MTRMFVAIWPPDDIVERLVAIPRPEAPGLRWTAPDRLHVTLTFLGEADEAAVAAALGSLRLPPADLTLGPKLDQLGRGVLMIPVRGLEDHARSVREATRHLGQHQDDRPFVGHLTVARSSAPQARDHGARVDLAFTATDFALVRVEPSGAYVDVERFSLG